METAQRNEHLGPSGRAQPFRPRISLAGALFLAALFSFPSLGLEDGEKIPSVTLTSYSGEKIAIAGYAKKRKKKNLLLLFFRTGTCSICTQQLHEVASHFDEIEKWNATVLALSLDDAMIQSKTAEKIEKKFPILQDPDAKTVNAFGVFNPEDKLSRPSIFLVGPDRKILYHYVGQAISDRPPLATILQAVQHYSGMLPKSSVK